jgi:hypothetical protein
MSTPAWTFTTPPATPRRPEVLLLAFSTGPLAGAGAEDAPPGIDVRTIEARQDPAWFAGWRSGSLRAIAEGDLRGALGPLDAADHVHLVSAAPVAPGDLGYLRDAWAAARGLVARGATIVLDVHAMTYRAAAEVPAEGAGFDARREIRIIFETSTDRPDGAHALHTRGLRKLGAPDLVALCTDADVELVGAVITQIAVAVAGGAELAPRDHAVDLDEHTTWHLVGDDHGLDGLLQLNNAARVLVDGDGAHLVGVAARVQAARMRS